MFILISFILIIPATFLGIYLPIINHMPFYYSIIFGIGGFLIAFAVSVLILIFSFLFVGKHYAKTYDPLDQKRWKFMNAGSKYVIFWMNARIKKVGFDQLNKDEHYVFYSNHQSFLDILTYDLVLKDFPRGSLYKIEHDDDPFLGGFAKALGGVGLHRYNPKLAINDINKAIKEVQKGRNFMIYPEGTRSRDGNLLKFHPGCFRIGLNSNQKICILLLDGLYHWYNYIPFIPKKFYVELIEVLDPSEYAKYTSVELAERCQTLVKNRLEELRSNK